MAPIRRRVAPARQAQQPSPQRPAGQLPEWPQGLRREDAWKVQAPALLFPFSKRSACSAVSQRPSFVIPIGTTSYLFLSIAFRTDAADSRDTSCSPLRPPNRMPTRIFAFAITSQSGARGGFRQSQPWFAALVRRQGSEPRSEAANARRLDVRLSCGRGRLRSRVDGFLRALRAPAGKENHLLYSWLRSAIAVSIRSCDERLSSSSTCFCIFSHCERSVISLIANFDS